MNFLLKEKVGGYQGSQALHHRDGSWHGTGIVPAFDLQRMLFALCIDCCLGYCNACHRLECKPEGQVFSITDTSQQSACVVA